MTTLAAPVLSAGPRGGRLLTVGYMTLDRFGGISVIVALGCDSGPEEEVWEGQQIELHFKGPQKRSAYK